MSKLLNRGKVFVIVRYIIGKAPISIGVFSELSEADDYKGMCEQQWKEQVGHLEDIEFEIQMTTYYGK